MPSIDQIIGICFPAIVKASEGPGGWSTPRLAQFAKDGHLKTADLGFEFRDEHGFNHNVAEISTIMRWAKNDELSCNTEAKQIEFVRALLVNALKEHDIYLTRTLYHGRTIIDKNNRYMLGERQESTAGLWKRHISTAAVFIG